MELHNLSTLSALLCPLTCYIDFKQVPIKDDEGNYKINKNGHYMKKDAGCFNASNTFSIDDLDIDEKFDE